MSKVYSNKAVIASLVIPGILLFVFAILAPICLSVYYGFTDFSGIGAATFIGWNNNKELLLYRARDSLNTPRGDKVDGLALHWYTGGHFESVRLTTELFPDKILYFTEGCVEYSRFGGMTDLEKAEMYAHDIIGNLNAGIHGSLAVVLLNRSGRTLPVWIDRFQAVFGLPAHTIATVCCGDENK